MWIWTRYWVNYSNKKNSANHWKIINQQKVTATNDPTDLLSRINQQHGTHTIDWAEKLGLGTKKYKLVSIDKE